MCKLLGFLHVTVQAFCGRINEHLEEDVPNCDREVELNDL